MLEHFQENFVPEHPELKELIAQFERIEVPARCVLLEEGAISRKMHWIESGCIRAGFNQDGKDITFQFFFEKNMVASLESFWRNIPSEITLETIEPCILWVAEGAQVKEKLQAIQQVPELRELFVETVMDRTFDYMRHCLSYIKDTPQQRYVNLIREKPQLLQRVPQHYIASYLGISKVHLSRIRSKMLKEGI